MKSIYKIIFTVMFFTLISCNEESLIEGRVVEEPTITELNINHNATKNNGNSPAVYPININNENISITINYNYNISSSTSGNFVCSISFLNNVNGYKSATTSNLIFKVFSENVEITNALFTNPNFSYPSSTLVSGLYSGNLTTNPVNWSLISATPYYSSPYNLVTFTNLNNGYLIFSSADNSIKGWIEYQLYNDKIILSRIGYRKWGSISTGK